MIEVDRLEDLGLFASPLHLAMGVFDGIHRGHQAVIQRVLDGAAKTGGLPGVLTFEPHPVSVVAPQHAPRRLLASIGHKKRVLADLGVRLIVVVHFDELFSKIEPDEFIRELSGSCRQLAQLAVGDDWRFGNDRKGDVKLLRKLGDELSVAIDAVAAIDLGEDRISSTRIREAISKGDFAATRAMLGRDYSVIGKVVAGQQLGRKIGFPTANLSVMNEQLPPTGVYAVRARLGRHWHYGVGNLGQRPTVEQPSGRRLLEVHLFDFEGDLYHRELEVIFGKFLRGERKFEGVEQLRQQIEEDARAARVWAKLDMQ